MDFGGTDVIGAIVANWHVWFVTVVLIVAAVIDGWILKVPNWLTFPFIISGCVFSFVMFGMQGLGWSLLGVVVGLALLLPAYAIGGMGAGDVKLLAGVGAWMWGMATFHAFCVTTVVGAIMAVCMVLYKRAWTKHYSQFNAIVTEIVNIRDADKLSAIAAERKSRMFLLPYGIPIAVGSILYFAWAGLLL